MALAAQAQSPCPSANRVMESGESGVAIQVNVNSLSLLGNISAPEIITSGRSIKLNADQEGNDRIGRRRVYTLPGSLDRFEGTDRYENAKQISNANAFFTGI